MANKKIPEKLKKKISGRYIREKRKLLFSLSRKFKISVGNIRKIINNYESRKALYRYYNSKH